MLSTITALLLGLIILITAVAGTFFVVVYWRLIQRPVPKLDGTIHMPSLDDDVEVLRDKHGIPHIYAQNRADLFRAQGYVHAQDRLWQMEQNRRIARGTLAEVFGEAALEADRFSRVIGFWRAAQDELATLDETARQLLDWYAEGVNGYIDAHPGNLAAEFNLLRVKPEPWTAADTLGYGKVMAWSLSVNWESELTRLRLAMQMDPIRASELEPDYPAANPVILDALSTEESVRLLSTTGLLLAQYEQIREQIGQNGTLFGVGQGSNSWVLAPKASLSGRPLLANDPHLALTMPGTWYENHLSCPGFEVSGASLPGAPCVLIGHNESIAWGLTNAFADVQDLFVERQHPDDPTRFEFRGQWEEAKIVEERIIVRKRAEPHIERVTITRHGPLISNLLDGLALNDPTQAAQLSTIPLALSWTGHQPGSTVTATLRINEATTWDEFDAALEQWSSPPQNFVYADKDGYIGYLMAGQVPQRENNPGLLPMPGWTGEHEWEKMIPHAELPRLTDPASGVIVTANNKMVADDYPHFLGIEQYPGWRAARLTELLETKERYTVRDMEEMQMDTLSKYAQSMAPWFMLVEAKNTWESIAMNDLRDWSYRMEVDATAPTVFHFILLELLQMTFGDKVDKAMANFLGIASNPLFGITGFAYRAEARLLELIETQERSPWYTDVKSGRERTREELLQEAFTAAVQRLRDEAGESHIRWEWGRHHQVRFVHPMGSVRMLKTFFNRGPFPIGGDGTTPLQTRHAPRQPLELVQVVPSYRQVYEVGKWDEAKSVVPSGQSGHPLSDQYDDQISMWREGVYHAMPWSRAAVEELTVYRMKLVGRVE